MALLCGHAGHLTAQNGIRPGQGTWPDVNYEDETNAKWKPMLHPDRLLSMARSYHCPACAGVYSRGAVTSLSADFNLNALKDTYDHGCFLARLDKYWRLMT